MDGFVKHTTKYIEFTGEAPFAFGEKQLHSALVPALSDFTDAFLVECPIQRKYGSRKKDRWDSSGWVDYWSQYRGIDFFIELKHGFDTYTTDVIKKRVGKRWYHMINDQLKSIKKEAISISISNKGLFLLPIHIITVPHTIRKNLECTSLEQKEELKAIADNYFSDFDPQPNWIGMWLLDKNVAEQCYYEYEHSREYYPAVLMVSRVEEMVFV
jgi:hypothetical protein